MLTNVSVVVPAYNEEKNLFQNISHIHNFLTTLGYKFEIIIVNDGSKDKTQSVGEELEKKFENIKVISYKQNQGKGFAIKQGVLKASNENVIFLDADLSCPIEYLPLFLQSFQKDFDIVVGSKN